MLHIVEWNGTMLHSGMKWSCFICQGVLWSTDSPRDVLQAVNSHFFIFSSYERSECFILWSETEQCFIWKGVLWSTASPYEAQLTLHEAALRAMKRSLFRLHVFLPIWDTKLCSNNLIYLPKFANLDFLENTTPDATLKNVILRFWTFKILLYVIMR